MGPRSGRRGRIGVELLGPLGVVAVLIVAASLAAGLVDRAPLSFPILFLGLGLALGPGATDLIDVQLDDPLLQAVAVTTLSLVLFLDAVNLRVDELKRDWSVPALTLGPGTALTIGLTALAAVPLLGLSWTTALLLGAALASTDAVTLRDVLREERLPASVRRALAVEAGSNDIIILPILLVLIAVATGEAAGALGWIAFLGQLLVLAPLVGAAVGVGGARIMAAADRRAPVRTEYQSLYGIGLVLAAFVAGELVGGSGFLAAFAAGIAVSVSNHTLCDCFLDLGQVVAEVLLLGAFVLFGAVLSGQLADAPLLPAALLALLLLVVIRPGAVAGVLTLRRASLSGPARLVIGWFGPRGLASLLLALLAVNAGVPDGERLFAIVGVVVIVSVVLHGSTATPLSAWYGRQHGPQVQPEDRAISGIDVLQAPGGDGAPRIEVDDLARRLAGPQPPLVVDVRTAASRRNDPEVIPGSLWVPPDRITAWATKQQHDRLIALWCT